MKTTVLNGFMAAMLINSMVSCSSAKKTTENGQPNGGPPTTDQLFLEMDSNNDGKLAISEVKGPLENDYTKIDTNGDGFISREEMNKAPKPSEQRPKRGQGGQQGQRPNGGN